MKKIILTVILIFIVVLFIFFKKYDNNIANQSEKQIVNEESTVENIDIVNNIENSLEGKTIAFIGDSLIEGYGNDYHGFDYYLSQDLPNTKFINNSKSGSTITNNSGNDNIIMINQAKTLQENADIIVFDGGANDIIGYSLGFLNNDLKKDIGDIYTNKESVITDLREVVLELKNKYPNSKLCYFNPFLIDDDTIVHLVQDEEKINDIKDRRDEFFTQVQILCNEYDISYIDLSNVFFGTELTYRRQDYIHINENGYKLMTQYLLEKLKEL